jgi:hypothetical protein
MQEIILIGRKREEAIVPIIKSDLGSFVNET